LILAQSERWRHA